MSLTYWLFCVCEVFRKVLIIQWVKKDSFTKWNNSETSNVTSNCVWFFLLTRGIHGHIHIKKSRFQLHEMQSFIFFEWLISEIIKSSGEFLLQCVRKMCLPALKNAQLGYFSKGFKPWQISILLFMGWVHFKSF